MVAVVVSDAGASAEDEGSAALAVFGVEEEEEGDGEHCGEDAHYDGHARPKRREFRLLVRRRRLRRRRW